MDHELGRWLLAYPIATSISQLAVDAHRLGLVPFPEGLSVAIATNLRRQVARNREIATDHPRAAEFAASYRRSCRLMVERGRSW